ncbi:Alpha/Beta hydrolase protein, partial [Mycena capillaripes]
SCSIAQDSLTCLRTANAAVLEMANHDINTAGFFHTFSTVPVIDGVFITQRPTSSFLEGKVNGEALLSVTNTFEGTAFVNQSVNVTAAQYSLELFPKFGTPQANSVGALYAGLGTEQFQVNDWSRAVAIFICPTYDLLNAFSGRSFKGKFSIPPGLHGHDVVYYFPGTSTPPFNNADFINAFAQSFTSFIINLDPNIKVSNTITPHWNMFNDDHTEMLFNMTAAGAPVVRQITTSNALLNRCRFWESVGNLTGQ